jgi:hypothetical protein
MRSTNIDKNLYKIFLALVKYIPITIALIFTIHQILMYLKILNPMLMYIGGTSFVFIVLLYILSFVFRFCSLYRIHLHYVTVGNTIGVLDTFLKFPISNLSMFRLYFILFGIMLIIYIWLMYKNRNNPKVDPIKQLCETYCDCNCD